MPKKAHDRELIDTGTDKRFVRRDDQGQFKESDDVGALARPGREEAGQDARCRPSPAGQGDKGDRKPAK